MCVSLQFQVDPVKVLSGTCRSLWRPLGYLRNPEKRLACLVGARSQLLGKKDDLNNRVRPGQKPTNQFQDWLDRVDSVNAKVSQIQTDERSFRWCINRQAEKWLADIAALQEASNFDVVAANLPPNGVQEEPSAGAGVTATQQSMGSYLSQFQAYLRDDEIRIIGIWGMGGVGKTTLLHSLNNELHSLAEGGEPPQFEQVIWVVASKDYKVFGVFGRPTPSSRHFVFRSSCCQ